MEKIYLGEQGWRYFLYPRGNAVCLRSIRGEAVGRPRILCRDYLDGLSDICHNGVIYYCCRDLGGNILVRSTADQSVLYFRQRKPEEELGSPVLAAAGDEICLFFICRDGNTDRAGLKGICCRSGQEICMPGAEDGLDRIDCIDIAGNQEAGVLLETWNGKAEPSFFVLKEMKRNVCAGGELHENMDAEYSAPVISVEKLIYQSSGEELGRREAEKSRKLEESLQAEERQLRVLQDNLQQERQERHELDSLLQDQHLMIGALEGEKKELQESICRLESSNQSLENSNQSLENSNRSLENSNQSLEISNQRLEMENRQLQGILDSVKKQYEELMDTASKYREEAIRWRNRCRTGK